MRIAKSALPTVLCWETHDPRVLATATADNTQFRAVALRGRPGSERVPETLSTHDIADRWHALRRDDRQPRTDAEFAAAAVALGMVDGAVGGAATTSATVLRAGLRYVGATGTVSMAMLADPPSTLPQGRRVILADCAVVPNPTARQLADIAVASARTWTRVDGTRPVVAFIAATTRSSEQAPAPGGDEIERIQQALALVAGSHPELAVDGELQVDAALIPDIAGRKLGRTDLSPTPHRGANVLVFPTLLAANAGYKLLQHLGGYFITPITQQLRRPFFDLSRGCSTEEFRAAALQCAALATTMDSSTEGASA